MLGARHWVESGRAAVTAAQESVRPLGDTVVITNAPVEGLERRGTVEETEAISP
jgi:hypothetical protein